MGLFKFVKNAGASLFKKKKKEDTKPAEAEEIKKANSAELVNLIHRLGFSVESLDIEVDDDKVIVGGKVKDQATREKIVLAIGNVDGVAEVEDNLEVEAPEPEARFHTVVRGDTLSKIAKEYYGNAMKYPVIFEANKPMLTDPDKIYPGQVLRIPQLSE